MFRPRRWAPLFLLILYVLLTRRPRSYTHMRMRSARTLSPVWISGRGSRSRSTSICHLSLFRAMKFPLLRSLRPTHLQNTTGIFPLSSLAGLVVVLSPLSYPLHIRWDGGIMIHHARISFLFSRHHYCLMNWLMDQRRWEGNFENPGAGLRGACM